MRSGTYRSEVKLSSRHAICRGVIGGGHTIADVRVLSRPRGDRCLSPDCQRPSCVSNVFVLCVGIGVIQGGGGGPPRWSPKLGWW